MGYRREQDRILLRKSAALLIPHNLCRASAAVLLLLLGPAIQAAELSFSRDIRPLLNSACVQCHGFDTQARQADLRLDRLSESAAELERRGVVIPGDSAASALIQRVTSSDPEFVMPPPESEHQLTAEQAELLRRWVDEGADSELHWAFQSPQPPAIPNSADQSEGSTPVDRFIHQRLQQEGLQPGPPADRNTLIRRVAFVLTGLPPSPEQLHNYLNDPHPAAYARMVDVFLESPHYGEERARHWLDLARYADTHGLHLDNERQIWVYRDWVISAFNNNLPFDQFTTWQLAGDLLPEATLEQQTATGFHRCNVSTSEGGSIADEWLFRNAVDRTSTVMQTWMGLTAGCAVCHDHKYDPISTKDFYSLYAFFYSAADPGLDGNVRDTKPFLSVPDEHLQGMLELKQARLRQAEEAFLKSSGNADGIDPESAAADVQQVLIDEVFPHGSRFRDTSRNSAPWVFEPEFGVPSGQRCLSLAWGNRYDLTLEPVAVPMLIPDSGVLKLYVRTDVWDPPEAFAVQLTGTGGQQASWGEISLVGGGERIGEMPAPGKWVRIEVSLERLGIRSREPLKSLVVRSFGGRMWLDSVSLDGRLPPDQDPRASFGQWLKSAEGTQPEGIPAPLAPLLIRNKARTAEEMTQLHDWWIRRIARLSALENPMELQALRDAEAEVQAVRDRIPGTMVFTDLPQPRQAHVMQRGQYDQPGEAVDPGFPSGFTGNLLSSAAQGRATRLDLARWLLDEENPLTARVAVNRIWQQVFGTGLVRTSEDFGTQGELPSHPQLLDWLAIEFRRSGWDQKRMFRLLLNTATFRRDSGLTAQGLTQDPGNRLLARGPRVRLDAEQIRDNVLFVSGLLEPRMGGPGVRTYQPEAIWEPVGYANSNTRYYLQDHGESLYRRSIYSFIKRTAPPPFLVNFDAPSREQFCASRARSNTPLQALQLMNDVQHFEAARVLAERVLSQPGDDVRHLIDLYECVLSRLPVKREIAIALESLEDQRECFRNAHADADQLIRNGESLSAVQVPADELAAWTMVCNLVLNLDETVTRN